MYDGILRIRAPAGVEIVGYADDIAVVSADRSWDVAVNKMEMTIAGVGEWLNLNHLNMAPEKTEVINLRYGRPRKEAILKVQGEMISLSGTVKYLGVTLDSSIRFGPHIRKAVERAETTVRALSRVMPNVGGPGEWKRRVLAMAMADMQGIQDGVHGSRMRAGGPGPIHLLVRERAEAWRATRPQTEETRAQRRRATIDKWQEEWARSTKGAWTRVLIPDFRLWVGRKEGQTSYCLTQALSGHGSFKAYRHRIGKAPNETCDYCGTGEDTPDHTLFHCPAWHRQRLQMSLSVGEAVTPTNLVAHMVQSAANWRRMENLISSIMARKEREEREREE